MIIFWFFNNLKFKTQLIKFKEGNVIKLNFTIYK